MDADVSNMLFMVAELLLLQPKIVTVAFERTRAVIVRMKVTKGPVTRAPVTRAPVIQVPVIDVLLDRTKLAELRGLFHLTLPEAARATNRSQEDLEKICKRLGIERWPYDDFVELRRQLADSRQHQHQHHDLLKLAVVKAFHPAAQKVDDLEGISQRLLETSEDGDSDGEDQEWGEGSDESSGPGLSSGGPGLSSGGPGLSSGGPGLSSGGIIVDPMAPPPVQVPPVQVPPVQVPPVQVPPVQVPRRLPLQQPPPQPITMPLPPPRQELQRSPPQPRFQPPPQPRFPPPPPRFPPQQPLPQPRFPPQQPLPQPRFPPLFRSEA
jgi:RWP-RK domain